MASTGICPFCGAVVTSEEKNCPNCGGENPNYIRDQLQQIIRPKTLSELKEYCAERGMPLLRMRFFIGVNIQEPRAFGIYQEGGRFIVYKNKSDGSRAVRYNGPDEAYAVNEIYTKLIDECHNRGIYPDQPGRSAAAQSRAAADTDSVQAIEQWAAGMEKHQRKLEEKKKKKNRRTLLIVVGALAALFVAAIISVISTSPVPLEEGYYLDSNSAVYLYQNLGSGYSKWHVFRDSWVKADMPYGTTRETKGKYQGKEILPEWNVTELKMQDEIPEGYYQFGENLYYYNGKWVRYRPGTDKWDSDFLGYDNEDRLILDYTPYYQGKDFKHEWKGHEYIVKEGYYRYNGKTSYYDSQSESWYTYDSGWKASSYPVNNFGAYYEGTACSGEWECKEMPLAGELSKGYYIYSSGLFYYTGDSWYESEYHKNNFGIWTRDYSPIRKKVSSYPSVSGWTSIGKEYPLYNAKKILQDPAECYQGYKNPAFKAQDFIQKGYYRQNNKTYYYDGSKWYSYASSWSSSVSHPDTMEAYEGTAVSSSWGTSAFRYPSTQKTTTRDDNDRYSNSWDSDWGSNDYDSWDSGSTDWDSDW